MEWQIISNETRINVNANIFMNARVFSSFVYVHQNTNGLHFYPAARVGALISASLQSTDMDYPQKMLIISFFELY